MREVDKPVRLTVEIAASEAARLRVKAAEHGCSVEELIGRAVASYRQDREHFTDAISKSAGGLETGRYQK